MTRKPAAIVDQLGPRGVDRSEKNSEIEIPLEADKNMRMIRHAINGHDTMAFIMDHAAEILLDLGTHGFGNEILSTFHCENNLDINLQV